MRVLLHPARVPTTRDDSPADPPAPDDFAGAVRVGLSNTPKTIPCRYLYDETGSRLFERICELPEYYLTRTEDAILRRHAAEMVAGRPVLAELGSGNSAKSEILIAALLPAERQAVYIPIDVATSTVQAASARLKRAYPGLEVVAWPTDYETALRRLSERVEPTRPRTLAFLGSTLGNFDQDEAVAFLGQVRRALRPGDAFLFGVDSHKDAARLEAAYDDAEGVTERFIRNILDRVNRELEGKFLQERFAYQARYNLERNRVEMRLISRVEQLVPIGALGQCVRFASGESILVECSRKFTPEILDDLARRSGFAPEATWTDPDSWYAVVRWRLHPKFA